MICNYMIMYIYYIIKRFSNELLFMCKAKACF